MIGQFLCVPVRQFHVDVAAMQANEHLPKVVIHNHTFPYLINYGNYENYAYLSKVSNIKQVVRIKQLRLF